MKTLRRQLALAPHPRMKKVPTSWSPTLSTRWSSSSTSPSPSSTCSTHSAGGRRTPSLWLRGRRTCPWSLRRSLPLVIITIIIIIINEMMLKVMEERNENKTFSFFQERNPRVEQRKKKLFDQWFLFVIWSNPKSGFQFDCLQSYIFKSSFIILLTDWLIEPWKVPNCHRCAEYVKLSIENKVANFSSYPHIFAPYPKLMSFIQMLKIWSSHRYCEIHRNPSY